MTGPDLFREPLAEPDEHDVRRDEGRPARTVVDVSQLEPVGVTDRALAAFLRQYPGVAVKDGRLVSVRRAPRGER